MDAPKGITVTDVFNLSLKRCQKKDYYIFAPVEEGCRSSGCILLQATLPTPFSSAQPKPLKFSQRSSCIGHSLEELLPQLGPWPKDNFPNQGIEEW